MEKKDLIAKGKQTKIEEELIAKAKQVNLRKLPQNTDIICPTAPTDRSMGKP